MIGYNVLASTHEPFWWEGSVWRFPSKLINTISRLPWAPTGNGLEYIFMKKLNYHRWRIWSHGPWGCFVKELAGCQLAQQWPVPVVTPSPCLNNFQSAFTYLPLKLRLSVTRGKSTTWGREAMYNILVGQCLSAAAAPAFSGSVCGLTCTVKSSPATPAPLGNGSLCLCLCDRGLVLGWSMILWEPLRSEGALINYNYI